jgi:uncharacterized protein (DUF1501 family)
MLPIHSGRAVGRTCDGVSRRNFLKVGALGVAGLSLADVLCLQASAAPESRSRDKAVIMIFLEGGPSHIDTYDMKPDAPVEIRGQWSPVSTNVPGMQICEQLPHQATIAEKFAIIRNMQWKTPDHGERREESLTGLHDGGHPCIGSIVKRLGQDAGIVRALPPAIAMDGETYPAYLGTSSKPFTPQSRDVRKSIVLSRGITVDRLSDRHQLLSALDRFSRRADDAARNMTGIDAFNEQALAMITSTKARNAFDVEREPEHIRHRYRTAPQFLQARRLVEPGVKVVTLTYLGAEETYRKKVCPFGGGTWDTHGNNFLCLGHLLPQFDLGLHALLTDLEEHGMDEDVAVVCWGEFGRSPRITPNPGRTPGRNHWPSAGFSLLAGGGLTTGQAIGATDDRGGYPTTHPYSTQNVLATLYRVLGIDSATTLPDHNGRPRYLLDDRRLIKELV